MSGKWWCMASDDSGPMVLVVREREKEEEGCGYNFSFLVL